jgi:hypothetical protein
MKKFRWVVEFEVSENWVADGFELTKDRAKAMIENDLAFAHSAETKAKILKAPNTKEILKVQGYGAQKMA